MLIQTPGGVWIDKRHITTTGGFTVTLDGSVDLAYELRFFGTVTGSTGSNRIGFQFNGDTGANYRNSWHKNVNGAHDIGAETLNGMNAIWTGSTDQYVFDAIFHITAIGGYRAAINGVAAVGKQAADDIVSEVSGQMYKSNTEITSMAPWYTNISTIDAYFILRRSS